MSTKAPGYSGPQIAQAIDALDGHDGYVSVELLNIERAISDHLREQNAKLRDELRAAPAATPPVGREIQPHIYMPDYQAMGDCRVCGHERDKPWHVLAPPASPTPAVGGEVVSYRWRPHGATNWIYDPTKQWLLAQNWNEIEVQPLYAALPASPLSEVELVKTEIARANEQDADISASEVEFMTALRSAPASPLRGREWIARAMQGANALRMQQRDPWDDLEASERDHWLYLADAALASPPEQPAAEPFQPHENCNCLMCLAEKPRDEP